jgi:hypothetical protein
MKKITLLLLLCISCTAWATWSNTAEDLVFTKGNDPLKDPSYTNYMPLINSDGSVMMIINSGEITAYGKLPNSDWSEIGKLLISDPMLSDYTPLQSFDSLRIAASSSLEKFVSFRNTDELTISTFSFTGSGWSISESTINNLSNVVIDKISMSKNGQRIAISYANSNYGTSVIAVYENLLGGWVPVGEPIQAYPYDVDEILLDENGDNLVIYDTPSRQPDPMYNQLYAVLTPVRIFTYTNGAWNQKGNRIFPSGNFDLHGMWVQISSDGQRIAISSPHADGMMTPYGADKGRVDIYQFDNSNWQLITGLYGDDPGDLFGYNFNFCDNGNRIAIGSLEHNDMAGYIKVFDYDSSIGSYTQVGNDINGTELDLNGSEPSAGNIGYRFAMSGDGTTIISMNEYSVGYPSSDGTWTETLKTYEYSAPTDESLDSDGDGLTNATELSLGTNPNLVDTDSDGFPDGWEVSRNLDPTINSSDFISNINAYGYYSTEQISDLRPGSTMIEVENGQATLSMEVEQSDDLEIWTSGGTTNLQVPIDPNSDTKFFRFKMAE